MNSDFTDSSTYNHTPTTVNSPTIDGAAPKFGAGAGDFVAASTQYVTYPNTSLFDVGTGDFTIDCQAKWTSNASTTAIYNYGKKR